MQRSIYVTDEDWEAIQEFASIVGFKKAAEFVTYTTLMVMNHPDLYWIYKSKEITKRDLAIKKFLQKRVNNTITQIERQGIDLSEVLDPDKRNEN